MKKVFILILLLLTSCQTIDPNAIKLNDVLSSFEEQQITLKEIKISGRDLFGMKLNGVRPYSYELNDKLLLIYIYNSNNERKKGLQEFRNKTADTNVASFKLYEVENVLIFYVYERDLNVHIEEKMKKVLPKLKNLSLKEYVNPS
ncbi:hypothetical protein SAMN05877753_106206 [Bacillus oleivorans]|uniref:Uncharacterized protein n=1 Tax=Bacillus oleivorans TaxID=1448271 RepID=A0A285CZ20_9BACI|nr:hypothetical protein [Bacillus oleivorans]SNX72791.1 hypothetical protein SAMN05877753_106206 [Bacillus oleivorans]